MDVWLVYAYIVLHPGCTSCQIARWLGVRATVIEARLIKMENTANLRVCEGEDGRLYPYSRNGKPSAWLQAALT